MLLIKQCVYQGSKIFDTLTHFPGQGAPGCIEVLPGEKNLSPGGIIPHPSKNSEKIFPPQWNFIEDINTPKK